MSVDADLLRTLLARSAESDDLDYKSTWDPGERSDLVELCKDIAAMESLSNGGYVLVGSDDRGNPSGTFSVTDPSKFDEQKIRSRVVSVLGEPIDLSCSLHRFGDHDFFVLGVGPNRDGMRIMPKDGEYPGKTVWREGDVFVRRGTSSIRWNQHEARGIVERIVAARKDDWRRDILETIRVATPVYEADGYVNINVEVPAETFAPAVTELMRRHDEIGLDLLIRKTVTGAIEIVEGIEPESDRSAVAAELGDQLERLDIIAILSARYEPATFSQVLEGFQRIYDAVDKQTDIDYATFFPEGQREVLTHAYAIGAALVAEKRWPELAALVRLAPVKVLDGFWPSLLRKAEVRIARANLLQDENGARIGLIEASKPVTARLFSLLGESRDGDLTNLLVEVDVYRGIATSSTTKLGAYPNFSLYNSPRAETAFRRLLDEPSARAALFAGSDEELATIYAHMDAAAQREAFSFNGWDGFDDAPLRSFVDEHSSG